MVVCYKCKTIKNEDTNEIFPCDSCKKFSCVNYVESSASEIRCLSLKKRKLMLLCEECENGILMIPTLIKRISEMQMEVDTLKQSVNRNPESTPAYDSEDLISEMLERQSRSSNVIVFNVRESQQNTQADRIAQDKASVMEILDGINIEKRNVKLFRLGKFSANKTRPIKVILDSAADAKFFLKNKHLIKIPSINIYSDQTKAQRQYFQQVKHKLQEMEIIVRLLNTLITNQPLLIRL